MTTVYTGGTFDLFHAGHVNFLRAAKKLGDRLVVALNTDEFVAKFKREPICTYQERYDVIDACKHVNQVIPNFGEENSGLTIDYVGPQIIAIGDDWLEKDYLGQLGINNNFLIERNIKIIYLSYTQGVSTTDIIRRIVERNT